MTTSSPSITNSPSRRVAAAVEIQTPTGERIIPSECVDMGMSQAAWDILLKVSS